jgi:uncharacterized protein (TIGR03084 family)
MEETAADFVAESGTLGALLDGLSDAEWAAATPAVGWDVRDSVTHLAAGNEAAEECARTGKASLIEEVMRSGAVEEYERRHLDRGRQLHNADLLEWWRQTVETLAAALRGVAANERVTWGPSVMTVRSLATARLMETWAHGLDCFDALDRPALDTERLFPIARLGLRALPYAFGVHGLPAPGSVRLELLAPDGSTWRLGEDDAPTVIRGTAGDWCRAAVHRDRRGERGRLRGTGPDADAVIRYVQAYLVV